MSNAARKERKRLRHEGVVSYSNDGGPTISTRFQHPVKVGTPVTARAAFQARPIHSGGRQQASRFGLPSRMKQRLAAYVGEANARQTAEFTQPVAEPVEYIQNVEPAKPALDPKPFRIGRKRYTLDEAVELGHNGEDVVWSPRKDYETDRAVYGG